MEQWCLCMIFLTLTLMIDVQLTVSKSGDSDENTDETERIVNGHKVKKGMFPWTVALFYRGEFICTASIISDRAILTAAHCVTFNGIKEKAEDFLAIVGSTDKSRNSNGMEVLFSQITRHPKYDNLLNDLAILTTREPMQLSEDVQPICLASQKTGSLILKSVISMGWGITTRDTEVTETPDDLQYAKLRVYPNTKCSLLYRSKVPKSVLCAGALNTGVCSGDSGGPLIMKQRKKYVQVGVASFVNTIFGCARALGPGGYTRVSSYQDFIKAEAPGNVCFS